jgi:3'(2'), 5'-bisphosphate nucleotidase
MPSDARKETALHSDITSDGKLLDELTTIVSHAAAAILAVRASALNPRSKADLSPVTAADEASEAIILDRVSRLLPGIPVVSEEAVERTRPAAIAGDLVLVDPVDGTRELVAGRDEFSVNVGVVREGRPAIGVIAAPAFGLIWRTAAGGGAERLSLLPGAPANAASDCVAIRCRPLPNDGINAIVSRSHLDPRTSQFLARFRRVDLVQSGSAIKFCRVAEGQSDVYPRLGTTHEWDVAAGHAILQAAGGIVTAPDGTPLRYGRATEGFVVQGFIGWGDPSARAHLQL